MEGGKEIKEERTGKVKSKEGRSDANALGKHKGTEDTFLELYISIDDQASSHTQLLKEPLGTSAIYLQATKISRAYRTEYFSNSEP